MTRSLPWLASLPLFCVIVTTAPTAATPRAVVPPPYPEPPPASAPAPVSAVPGNANVKVSWSPVAGAAGYRVFRGANGLWNPTPIATTSGTTHTSLNLANGTTYSFTVTAYTNGGNGPTSLAVIATPLAPPADVTARFGDRQVTLNWQVSEGATTYTVYRMGSDLVVSELATGVLAPPFVDTGLMHGTRYSYQVRALTTIAQSELSARVSAR